MNTVGTRRAFDVDIKCSVADSSMVISSGQGPNSAEDCGQVIELALSILPSNLQSHLACLGLPPLLIQEHRLSCLALVVGRGESREETATYVRADDHGDQSCQSPWVWN